MRTSNRAEGNAAIECITAEELTQRNKIRKLVVILIRDIKLRIRKHLQTLDGINVRSLALSVHSRQRKDKSFFTRGT